MEDYILAFKELGIAGIAIGALVYVVGLVSKELARARIDYAAFVNSNNHTTTELVKESITTMVETREAIKNHNEILKIMLDRLK